MNWRHLEPAAYARAGADLIADVAQTNPEAHLCLATGGSPTAVYTELSRRVREEGLDLSRLWITKLDEWAGLPREHPATCEAYLREHCLEPWGIGPDRYLAFTADAPDPEAEVSRVAAALRHRPPLDLSILGVGRNGHLGLNEPAERLSGPPHLSRLEEGTRTHGMLSELPEPPRFGMTLGLSDLFRGRSILLLIHGSGKGDAIAQLRTGEITTNWPVTLLNLHPRVEVLEQVG